MAVRLDRWWRLFSMYCFASIACFRAVASADDRSPAFPERSLSVSGLFEYISFHRHHQRLGLIFPYQVIFWSVALHLMAVASIACRSGLSSPHTRVLRTDNLYMPNMKRFPWPWFWATR